jgi:pimeloyl-[acyl-carrier protein] methyl ester esterase
MTRPLFLFVHGWAGTPRLWDLVRADLRARGAVVADMVTEVPQEGTGRPLIGIGHSLGSAWLLTQGPALAGFVAINGFTRFTATPDFPAGTHPRILMQMRRRLLTDPATVLGDFHDRAGLPLPDGLPDAETLGQGLDLLGSIDARAAFAALSVPHVALCGTDDLIVPPAHSRDSFPEPVMVPTAGHALPISHPGLCADHILSLAAQC